jgi:hypothetical protein
MKTAADLVRLLGAYSNCIVFALLLYLRRRAKGHKGYIIVRRSRWGKFPHVLYMEPRADPVAPMRIVSFVPRSPKRRRFPPPMFRGRSKWGDLE